MERKSYPSDLSDEQWSVLSPVFPEASKRGRPCQHSSRALLNAIFYWLVSGCQWRMLPHDLPPWQTVYHYFRSWRQQGLWEQVHGTLRAQERIRQGRGPTPSA